MFWYGVLVYGCHSKDCWSRIRFPQPILNSVCMNRLLGGPKVRPRLWPPASSWWKSNQASRAIWVLRVNKQKCSSKARGPERVCQIHGWSTQSTETSHCSLWNTTKAFRLRLANACYFYILSAVVALQMSNIG